MRRMVDIISISMKEALEYAKFASLLRYKRFNEKDWQQREKKKHNKKKGKRK